LARSGLGWTKPAFDKFRRRDRRRLSRLDVRP